MSAEAVVEVEYKENGSMTVEIPDVAVVALGIKGDESVGVYIDTASKRLIYQF